MNWIHFYFTRPNWLDLAELQKAERMQAIRAKWQAKRKAELTQKASNDRLSRLEEDVGYMALVLGSILDRLNEKGIVTKDEVKAAILKLDELDGVRDGRLDVTLLRQLASPEA